MVIHADMPASGSLTKTVHESGDLMTFSAEKEWASVKQATVNHVWGCLIVDDQEKADAANLASFQSGESLFQAEEYGRAEEVFGALSLIDYPNAKEKADEARNALMKAKAKKEEIYQKAVALEEAEDYEQAISIYEGLGDYKDCAERIMACNEKNEKKTKYQTAVQKEEDGDYSGAFQAYEELGDYKDSIARGSFCVKKYQALNRLIRVDFATNMATVYSYDEQGLPQCVDDSGTFSYIESYTLDSEGYILAGKRETEYKGQAWDSKGSYDYDSDIVYN